jgi:hypothetical protein
MEDLTGMTFGTIKVLNYQGKKNRHHIWKCICLQCGSEFDRCSYCLKITHMKGCKKCGFHHGSRTRLYRIWQGIKSRCFNKKYKLYEYYGARGITMCDKWHDFINFQNWALDHGYKDNLSIERINVNENYSLENCKWATNQEQQNNKRKTRRYTINGETRSLAEWCLIYKQIFQTVSSRIKRGMKVEDAIIQSVARRTK